MPMYDYQCTNCKSITSRFRKIAERNDRILCSCEGDMRLVILKAPSAQIQPECHYVCPATGEKISSWRQRKNSFAKNGLQAVDEDQMSENKSRAIAKKKKRDALAENYLPKDLKEKISDIGQNSDNPFHS